MSEFQAVMPPEGYKPKTLWCQYPHCSAEAKWEVPPTEQVKEMNPSYHWIKLCQEHMEKVLKMRGVIVAVYQRAEK